MNELIILGGANGSGKTTFSKQILVETGYEFLNADEIETKLAISKLQAGKEFFRRLDDYISNEISFVLERTLSGNYLAKVIEKAKLKGYVIKIVYIYLESPEDCIQRIKLRVKLGGHFIEDADVICRYYRSKVNFWRIYKNLANDWVVIYNSTTEEPQKIALGVANNYVVELENIFNDFLNNLEQ